MDRRNALKSVAFATASAGLIAAGAETLSSGSARPGTSTTKNRRPPWIEAKDGTTLFYKDWGTGKPVVFIAAWCLNSAVWDYQTNFLTARQFRCVAYDRRGHGRSAQPGEGYDYDTLAGDLASVLEQLDLRGVTLVGHSMGSGEVVRYLTRHGSARVERIVLVAPTTPFLMKAADNPDGIDKSFFEGLRAAVSKDFPGVLWANWPPFFVKETSHQMMEWAAGLMLQTPLKVALDCNRAFSETDFRAELPKIKLPTLIIQGDKDVSAPIDLVGRKTAKLIPHSEFKVYEGAPHGLILTHADRLNADLLAFIQS